MIKEHLAKAIRSKEMGSYNKYNNEPDPLKNLRRDKED
jgi:hypothetical protein